MTTATRETIPAGDAGAQRTLEKMRFLVNDSLAEPLVNETAHRIVQFVGARDYLQMAHTIRAWLAGNFRFIPDPVGVELLRNPVLQLQTWEQRGLITGDCDDAAILGAALGKSVGIRAVFVAVGFSASGPLAHVYTILTGPPNRPISVDLDVTKPVRTAAVIRRRVVVTV